MKRFYVCKHEEDIDYHHVRKVGTHETQEEAIERAERLTEKNGVRYHVFSLYSSLVVTTVVESEDSDEEESDE